MEELRAYGTSLPLVFVMISPEVSGRLWRWKQGCSEAEG